MTISTFVEKLIPAVGNIERIFFDPCAQQPALWVAVGVGTALTMIEGIISPDPKEIYHKVVGQSFVCSVKGIIAEGIERDSVKNELGTKYLFRSLEWVDQATWDLYLADLALIGLANWSTVALKYACDNKKPNPYKGNGIHWFGGLEKDGRWQTCDYAMNAESVYAPVTPSSITVKPGLSGYISAYASFITAHTDTRGSVSQRIINKTHGTVFDVDQADIDHLGGARTSSFMPFLFNNTYDHDVEIAVEWSFTGTQSEPGTAMVMTDGWCSLYAFKD